MTGIGWRACYKATSPVFQPDPLVVTAPVFRFAPSPTGYLHIGHAYSVLLNADLAARAGGRVVCVCETSE